MPERCASIRSIAKWVLPVLVGPRMAVMRPPVLRRTAAAYARFGVIATLTLAFGNALASVENYCGFPTLNRLSRHHERGVWRSTSRQAWTQALRCRLVDDPGVRHPAAGRAEEISVGVQDHAIDRFCRIQATRTEVEKNLMPASV